MAQTDGPGCLLRWAARSKERRLGEVVSLVRDMVLVAKVAPNKHTFSRLLDACDKLDQAELAFELLTVMKARGMDIAQVGGARELPLSLPPFLLLLLLPMLLLLLPLLQRLLRCWCCCWAVLVVILCSATSGLHHDVASSTTSARFI